MNIRYVLSYIDREGLRKMVCPVQGRHTHETRKIAEEHLSALLNNNTEELLLDVYGPKSVGTFAVSAVECWPGHNDPKGCYIREELNPEQDVPEPWRK